MDKCFEKDRIYTSVYQKTISGFLSIDFLKKRLYTRQISKA